MLVGGNCSTDHLGGWSPMFESIHQFRPTALTSPTAVGRGPLSPQKAELSPQHIGEILKQLRPTPTAETVDGTSPHISHWRTATGVRGVTGGSATRRM